jgi:uncharacterized protein (TIGR03437 family)
MIRFDPTGAMFQSTYLESGTQPLQPGAIANGPGGTDVTVSSSPFPYIGRPTAAGVLQIGPDSTGASATSIGCWSNAASFEMGPLAAGELFSIFGNGLGPAAGVSATLVNGQFPGDLAGVRVTFDGIAAPLVYVQSSQINAVVPWELGASGVTQMCANWQAKMNCTTITLGGAAPGLFAVNPWPTGYGAIPMAAAVNQDGTINSPGNPAHVGSALSLFLAGLGPLAQSPADGSLVPFPLPSLVYNVQISVCCEAVPPNGPGTAAPAQILYAGPAPLEIAGLFQINITVPSFATGPANSDAAVGLTYVQVSVSAPGGTKWQSFQSALIAVAP